MQPDIASMHRVDVLKHVHIAMWTCDVARLQKDESWVQSVTARLQVPSALMQTTSARLQVTTAPLQVTVAHVQADPELQLHDRAG